MIFLNGINITLMEVHMFPTKFNHTRKIMTPISLMIINQVFQIINKIRQYSLISKPLLFSLTINKIHQYSLISKLLQYSLIINRIHQFSLINRLNLFSHIRHRYWIWNLHTYLTISLKCLQGPKNMCLNIEQQNSILNCIGHLIRIQFSNFSTIDPLIQNI